MDVVIEGNCFVSGRLEQCCIGVEDGRIAKIARAIEGDKMFNFGSKIVLPGAVDSHVHFREPGMTHKEDFGSGSLAALFGGVTCVLDMPNTVPPTTSVQALRDKRELARKSLVDYGLFAGIKPGMDVEGLAKEAVGFKLYMAGTTGDLMVPSLASVRKELAAVAGTGKVVAVHAEDESMRRKDPTRNLRDHLRNRSNECEASAIRKVKDAASGCRLHICHVSAKESLPLLDQAKGLTSEVTPHHLLLDSNGNFGTKGKVNPPLRRREDRQALFQYLANGGFDTIASDHAPHTSEEKEEEFDYAPSGMPGVETMLPLMLQHVREKHLTLGGVVKRLCERPSEIFGLNKGRIEVGYDADLVVVDMLSGSEIRPQRLHSRCGWTAYEGMSAIFPKAVFVRGEIMIESGSVASEARGMDVTGRRRHE